MEEYQPDVAPQPPLDSPGKYQTLGQTWTAVQGRCSPDTPVEPTLKLRVGIKKTTWFKPSGWNQKKTSLKKKKKNQGGDGLKKKYLYKGLFSSYIFL